MPQSMMPGPWRSSALAVGVAIALIVAVAPVGGAHTTAGVNGDSRFGSAGQHAGLGSQAGDACEDKKWFEDARFKVVPTKERNLKAWLSITMWYDMRAMNHTKVQVLQNDDGHNFEHFHRFMHPTIMEVSVEVEGDGQLVEAKQGPDYERLINADRYFMKLEFSSPGLYRIKQLRLRQNYTEFLVDDTSADHYHDQRRVHHIKTCVVTVPEPKTEAAKEAHQVRVAPLAETEDEEDCEDPSELERSMRGVSQRQQDAKTEARAASQQYRRQQDETGVMDGGPLPDPGTAAQDIETSVEGERTYATQLTSALETIETLRGEYNDIQQSAVECGCETKGQADDAAPDGGTQRDADQQQNEDLPTDISEDKALGAVADAFRERGLRPPTGSDLTIEDYLISSIDKEARGKTVTGTRSVSVRLGPDGHLLPKHEEAIKRARFDGDTAGSLQGATHWLDIDLFRVSENDFDAQINVVDVETGKIEESYYSGWDESNDNLADVINEALGDVEGRLREPTDGRVPDDQRVCGGTAGGGS